MSLPFALGQLDRGREPHRVGSPADALGEGRIEPENLHRRILSYEFPDEETLARAMLAPGLIVELIGIIGEEAVRSAIVEALAPYRTSSGGYRLENEWHTLIASA